MGPYPVVLRDHSWWALGHMVPRTELASARCRLSILPLYCHSGPENLDTIMSPHMHTHAYTYNDCVVLPPDQKRVSVYWENPTYR